MNQLVEIKMHHSFVILCSLFTLCCGFSINQPDRVFHMSQILEVEGTFRQHESVPSAVKFSFAKHFQDNMVLQRAPRRARIYGFSPDIGASVKAQLTVSPTEQYYFASKVEQGPATGVGVWAITLDPMNITTPVAINVVSHNGSASIQNVLFGDVWLCSGQSNMQFSVAQMLNAAQETADAINYPNIRLFTVTKVQSNTPLYDLSGIDENWSVPSEASLNHGAWTYFSSVCWVYGKLIHQNLGYPIGLVATDWGGTPVEAWSSPDALKTCHVETSNHELQFGGPQENSVLWNAMINPLLGMTIYGAIWYQGENDAAVPAMRDRYNCTFPSMIDDWRSKFSQTSDGQTSNTFPFGFVQLAANRDLPNVTVGFPDIRWHQTADYGRVPNTRMPNTFMAVAMDLPDFKSTYGSIHPRDKEDVGLRLALAGLNVAYNKRMFSQGPFPTQGYFIPPNVLFLDYGKDADINVKNFNGFELACTPSSTDETLIWQPTPVITHNATAVVFNTNLCKLGSLRAFRYAWRESPCSFKDCAVYSSINDLPAPPFIAHFTAGKDGRTSVLAFKS